MWNKGIWAMDPVFLKTLIDKVESYSGETAPELEKDITDISGNRAVINVSGTLMKRVPGIFNLLGIDATSTEDLADWINELAADDTISTIHLNIDSPGGSVDGIAGVTQAMKNFKDAGKKITAHADDLMASAAYWIGSQADELTAGPTARVGSIGVISTMMDSSKAHEDAGLKVHVISSHELKGTGTPGSIVTEEQLADVQRNIDTFATIFKSHVSEGRKGAIADVDQVATGQVWIGSEAQQLGLVDEITTKAPTGAKEDTMSYDMDVGAELLQLQEQVEALRKENEGLKAQQDATQVALATARQAQIDALLVKYDRKITPAMKEHVLRYADACCQDNAKDLETYLIALPDAVNPVAEGTMPGSENVSKPEIPEVDKAVAKLFGISDEAYATYGEADGITYVRDLDGSLKVEVV